MVIALCRSVILYLFLIIGLRLMGKRQIGELEPAELVFSLLIADLASVPMQDFGIPILTGLIPILTLLCLTAMLSVLSARNIRFRALLCGKPSIVIHNGRILQEELKKNRFTVDELLEELRMNGVSDLSTVKYAILETNGQISVLPYAAERPATAGQVNRTVPESGLPLVLISDGRLLRQNLERRGLSDRWLEEQLQFRGVQSAREVFLLTLDEQGQIYFLRKTAKP